LTIFSKNCVQTFSFGEKVKKYFENFGARHRYNYFMQVKTQNLEWGMPTLVMNREGKNSPI
jgi:hypothetical protein